MLVLTLFNTVEIYSWELYVRKESAELQFLNLLFIWIKTRLIHKVNI